MTLRLLILLAALQLVACGGGGSNSPDTPTTPPTIPNTPVDPPPATVEPTEAEIQAADKADLALNIELATSTLQFSWFNCLGAIQLLIQQQTDGSAWTTIGSIDRSLAPTCDNDGFNVSLPTTAAVKYRVMAVTSRGASLPLATRPDPISPPVTVEKYIISSPAIPNPLPSIAVDRPEPVSGQRRVSIAQAGDYDRVDYFYFKGAYFEYEYGGDYVGTAKPDYSTLVEFGHPVSVLYAFLRFGPDMSFELYRGFQVVPGDLRVKLQSVSGATGTVTFNVLAQSDFGIATVSASLDGASLGTISIPSGSNMYAFTANALAVGSGRHTFVATATTTNGKTESWTDEGIKFSNPPLWTVTAFPNDGLIAGTLNISGSATTDKVGGLHTVATLGSRTVLDTMASPFNAAFDLSGVTPGSYVLTLTSTDADGLKLTRTANLVVVSSSAQVYAPLAVLDQNQGNPLLATDDAKFLLRTSDGKIHLRAGSDVVLDTVGVAVGFGVGDWRLANGTALGVGDVFHHDFHVFKWAADGTRQDLGALDAYGQFQAVHWPWLLVGFTSTNNTYGLSFFNAMTLQKLTPTLANLVTPAASVGKVDFYESSVPGLVLYYPTAATPDPDLDAVELYSWDQVSGQSTAVATGLWRNFSPLTDGTRVAWRSGAIGSSNARTLVELDIAGNVQQNVSTTQSDFAHALAGGLLAWVDEAAGVRTLKLSDGASVKTIGSSADLIFYGLGNGYVLFRENAKLYAANAAGARQLVFDYDPASNVTRISGKTVYFTLMIGTQWTLYAATLN
jgi:hypothetical protein